jgi:hypothetical protein
MRIAFDLDGVLADLHSQYVRAAVSLFPELDRAALESAPPGTEVPAADTPSEAEDERPDALAGVKVNRRQSEAIWKHLGSRENFWQTLQETEPGIVRKIAQVADQRRWDVLFITSRPRSAGATVQRQTQRWLQTKGFDLPSVYIIHGSRGRLAAALDLDVVVDDRPDNCLDVVLESSAGAVLIWPGSEASVPVSARRLGIAVAKSVDACLEAVIAAESEQSGDSMLDRLRRLFGVRTKPAASGILRKK